MMHRFREQIDGGQIWGQRWVEEMGEKDEEINKYKWTVIKIVTGMQDTAWGTQSITS